jgi:hypothetical protein
LAEVAEADSSLGEAGSSATTGQRENKAISTAKINKRSVIGEPPQVQNRQSKPANRRRLSLRYW